MTIVCEQPAPVRENKLLAAGAARVLRAPAGPAVAFSIGPYVATARTMTWQVAAFDGEPDPVPPHTRIEVTVVVGENDHDRCGNSIGGGSFTAWGDTVDDALRAVAALPMSRRTRVRQQALAVAISTYLSKGA